LLDQRWSGRIAPKRLGQVRDWVNSAGEGGSAFSRTLSLLGCRLVGHSVPLYFERARLTHRLLGSLGDRVTSTAVHTNVMLAFPHDLDGCYLRAHVNNASKRASNHCSYLFVISDPISKSVIIRFLQFTHPPAIAASQQHNTQGV
jgi:hypothetical protein